MADFGSFWYKWTPNDPVLFHVATFHIFNEFYCDESKHMGIIGINTYRVAQIRLQPYVYTPCVFNSGFFLGD